MATLLHTPEQAAQWLAARVDAGRGATLRSDSRSLRPGDGFIAWPGAATDGRRFVAQALAAGAAACLVEAEGVTDLGEAFGFDLADPRIAACPGLKAATGPIASLFFGEPSRRLTTLAVTGTNGKTSSSWWLAQALAALGRRCAVVGTLGIGVPPTVDPTGLTTPDPVTLHAALRRLADSGVVACAMEASSIGIAEERLAGTQIDVALFTNFTRDHLDYHGSMASYWAAKRRLFDWPGLGAAVVNIDDVQGAALAQELASSSAPGPALWTVSLTGPARLRAQQLRYVDGALVFRVAEGGHEVSVDTALVGDYNAANLLGVIAALRALGVGLDAACAAAARVTPVPGRMQRVDEAGADDLAVVVDYAHTPDALDQVLRALRPLATARGGRLWCLFGCGGNRDATKRPLMGAIAARGADQVVITSDNPRDEPPAAILAQVLAGVTGHDEVAVIEDRREAIAWAVAQAAPGDVLLLAGKGHEATQEIAGVKRPFSDADEARAALAARRSRSA